MGMQKWDICHPCVSHESNDSLLSSHFFLSFVWLLLPHKKRILWPHSKIFAGVLRSLRCHSIMILRTDRIFFLNKRQEETFIRLLLLTSTAGCEVGKSPFSNVFTSTGVILSAFLHHLILALVLWQKIYMTSRKGLCYLKQYVTVKYPGFRPDCFS